MTKKGVTEVDRQEAMRVLLAGLESGREIGELALEIANLHPKNNTFPGEVYMRLAADVLADTGAAGAGPIEHERLRERHLADVRLRGKENRRFQYAVLVSAAVAGGLEPDLLEEVAWWPDDYWYFALLAAIALIRASAERRNVPVAEVATALAQRHGLRLDRGASTT